MKRYPKAFTEYWDTVEICGIDDYDDFKHEAYLAWKAGTKHRGRIRRKSRKT